MILTVTGGSGSGKSAFAEDCVLRFSSDRRIYLATMQAEGEEAQRRILRHRKLRMGKGFLTLERSGNLAGIASSDLEGANVLLEDVINLTANELFRTPEVDADAAQQAVLRGIAHIAGCAENLVLVTGQLGEDGGIFDPLTERYLMLLGRINRALAENADVVAEVACGIPTVLKGVLS